MIILNGRLIIKDFYLIFVHWLFFLLTKKLKGHRQILENKKKF
jgi:hypothetical protein